MGNFTFHDVEQNSPEWESLRLGKVTASKLPVIMANEGKAFGEPAKRYALQLALEIATGRKAEYSFKNDDMDRGHEQEPVARMLYEEMFFVEVRNGGFFDCGEHGDSPDGLIGEDGIAEIKSVIAPTHDATLRRGAADPAYFWQLVGHLEATEREWVDFISYCAEFTDDLQLLVFRTYRHEAEEYIERLRARRREFIDKEIGAALKRVSRSAA